MTDTVFSVFFEKFMARYFVFWSDIGGRSGGWQQVLNLKSRFTFTRVTVGNVTVNTILFY